jgi:hypothetical protein
LTIEHPFEDASIQIINVAGEIVKEQNLNSTKTQIHLKLAPGVYSLNIKNGENILTKKLIIL